MLHRDVPMFTTAIAYFLSLHSAWHCLDCCRVRKIIETAVQTRGFHLFFCVERDSLRQGLMNPGCQVLIINLIYVSFCFFENPISKMIAIHNCTSRAAVWAWKSLDSICYVQKTVTNKNVVNSLYLYFYVPIHIGEISLTGRNKLWYHRPIVLHN